MNKILDLWKNLDKHHLLTHYLVPYFVGGGLLFVLGLNIGGGGNRGARNQGEIDIPISSTVDLPTQIQELQTKQSLVLQKQLDNIVITDNNTQDVSEYITVFNQQNEIDDFINTVLSLKQTDSVETQYELLSKYLSTDNNTGADVKNVSSVEENTYRLIGGNSWAKEQDNQASKAGDSIISIMTGSNKDNRYYQVILPVTNQNRENANIIYFVHTDNLGKIVNCVYGGSITGKSQTGLYSKMSTIFKEK